MIKILGSNDLDVYHHTVDSVTAFVLAGGKSTRMGRGQDKAFLQLGGRTLLDRALELAGAAAGKAWIVGSFDKFAAFGPVIEDVYPGHGPLGGIHAALTKTDTELNLMVAVDLPFLRPCFLNYLIARGCETEAVVVVPTAGGNLQPLCALYRRAFADVAEQSLRAGRNKIDRLFSEVQTRVIDPEELKQNGFPEEMFSNVNTQEDWADARMRFSEGLQ